MSPSLPVRACSRHTHAHAHAHAHAHPVTSLDASATHFLLRLTPSLTPVGTIRCTKHARYYKLSRLAVLADCRRFRLGRALVLALHAHVQQDAQHSGIRDGDAVLVRAHSQLPARGFYAK